VPTTGRATAGEIARRGIAEGADLVVAAGGDGTINEVIEGMVHSHVPLGILPAGTANVLANETGMNTSLEQAARELSDYRARRISVGRLHVSGAGQPRHFLLMAGVGLDARIVYHLSAPLKSKLGKLAYWASAMKLIGRDLEEFDVKIDDRVHKCSFALISKVRNYGGDFEIARDTSLLDDRFEVVLFAGRSSTRYLKYFTAVALKRVHDMKGVTVLRARKVCLSAPRDPRVYIQVDGEYAGLLPGSIEIVPDALTLLIPPGYVDRVSRP
jgi:YegS/Rv2252/BmrU family lipid kinase